MIFYNNWNFFGEQKYLSLLNFVVRVDHDFEEGLGIVFCIITGNDKSFYAIPF